MTDSIPTLGAMSPVLVNLLIGLFLLISILMILLVLIQRPQGGGLSGAFGAGGAGAGAGQSAFGTKTGDMLTYATIGIFICFLGAAIVLNFVTRPAGPVSTETLISAPAGTTGIPVDESTDEQMDEQSDEQTDEQSGESTDESAQPVETTTEQINEIVDESTNAVEPKAEPETGSGSVPQEDEGSKPNVNAGDD